jgi:transcriptional regulator with XRE-family HTH domain
MQLKQARRRAGWTQAQLSARSGINQQIISRIESGQVRSPSYRTVIRLCRALGVQPEDIREFQLPENRK